MIKKIEVGLLARVLVNQALLILKDKEIAKLQKQVGLAQAATDRMESCYIQMKKEAEQLQSELKCCRRENAVLLGKVGELQAQLENMEACYIEKKKQVEECAALAAGWNEIAWDKTTHWTEGYEEGCYHCSAQIEEALRGEHD